MEMHELIFVDDESIVRDGIRNCVPWGSNGFNLAGIFENGEEALSFIEKNTVDVVISDINMPKMDGLTLSRILAEKHPHTTVILLTGYDEFEYAQNAIKNKVREFLLKPITADELGSILDRIHKELSESKNREQQQKILMEKLKLSFPLLKERFLSQLVSGRLELQAIIRRKDFFQWEDLGGYYQILSIMLFEQCETFESLSILDFLSTLKEEGDEVFTDRNSTIIVLLQGTEQEKVQKRAQHIAETVFLQAEKLSLAKIYIGIGTAVSDIKRIEQSYNGAYAAADRAKVLGFSQIISKDEIDKKEKVSPVQFHSLETALGNSLKEGKRSQSLKALKNIMNFLRDHYVSPAEASYYFTRIHALFHFFLQDIDLFPANGEDLSPPAVFFESISRAENYFTTQLSIIENRISAHRHAIVASRIEKARTIIAQNFRDKNFSLQTMCNELFLSTSQFSVIFKEGTGQTFIEYLTAYRIGEAKKLLKTTDLLSYEIADAVGYSDPRYFSITFKKHTGFTPMEYRRNLEK